ncbi:MAG TPA: hypothetical protein VGJ05_15335 [Fimbriiglobus sp.]
MVAFLLLAFAAPPPPAGRAAPEIGFGMPGNSSEYLPVLVLQKKPFAAELKLTPEQQKQVKELRAKLLERVKGARFQIGKNKGLKEVQAEIAKETDEAIPKILTPGQYKRFRELVWQTLEAYLGAIALAENPVAAKAIGISADQAKRIAEWGKEYKAALAEIRKNPTAARANRKAIDEKVIESLTAAQKEKWNALQGEMFKGPSVILEPGQRPLQFPTPKK